MGKKARIKRERQLAAATAALESGPQRQLPVFWIVIAVVALGALGTLFLTRNDGSSTSTNRDAPVYATVKVRGANLVTTPADNDGRDRAVGTRIPAISGTALDGRAMSIMPGGEPMVVVAVAHWCPHCQAEVPRLVDWHGRQGDEDLPRIVAVSTAASEDAPNFPPATWLEDEDWPFRTLVDDEAGSAADALGVENFPLLVFVNADGTVASRYAGEMPIDEFDERVTQLMQGS